MGRAVNAGSARRVLATFLRLRMVSPAARSWLTSEIHGLGWCLQLSKASSVHRTACSRVNLGPTHDMWAAATLAAALLAPIWVPLLLVRAGQAGAGRGSPRGND